MADCTKAIAIDPNDAVAYNDRGVAYEKKGDLDSALADYTKAIEIDPGFETPTRTAPCFMTIRVTRTAPSPITVRPWPKTPAARIVRILKQRSSASTQIPDILLRSQRSGDDLTTERLSLFPASRSGIMQASRGGTSS